MITNDREDADDRSYATLEMEMADAGGDAGWGDPPADSGGDDGPAHEAEGRMERQEPAEDDGAADEEASLRADELEHHLRQQYAHSQQHRAPDVYDDPLHHLNSVRGELQQLRSEREYKQFTGAVEQHENAFAAMTPDYHDAAKFLEDGRRSELAEMYPDRDPHAIVMARQQGFRSPKELRNAIFIQDAQTVAGNALRAGRNPAEAYYSLAKARGFQSRGGGRSGGRSSGGRGNVSVSKLTDLYADDPAEFDRQWDRMAKTGSLG